MVKRFVMASMLLWFLFCGMTSLEPKASETASGFTLSSLSDKSVSLSDFKGKPVILFFWSTWCPYCRKEFSVIPSEYRKMKASGIEFLAIDVDEQKSKVENFLNSLKEKIEFTVLLDKGSQVAYNYGVIGLPTFVLIDAQGKVQLMENDLPEDYSKILQGKDK